MQERASAPASSATRANSAMSATLGESLGMTGRRVALRTAATTSWVIFGSPPKAIPPFLTLGQEMLISSAATPGRVAGDARDLGVLLHGVAADVDDDRGVVAGEARAARRATNARTPTPCRPMAFSRPDGVSTMRGVAQPSRGSR